MRAVAGQGEPLRSDVPARAPDEESAWSVDWALYWRAMVPQALEVLVSTALVVAAGYAVGATMERQTHSLGPRPWLVLAQTAVAVLLLRTLVKTAGLLRALWCGWRSRFDTACLGAQAITLVRSGRETVLARHRVLGCLVSQMTPSAAMWLLVTKSDGTEAALQRLPPFPCVFAGAVQRWQAQRWPAQGRPAQGGQAVPSQPVRACQEQVPPPSEDAEDSAGSLASPGALCLRRTWAWVLRGPWLSFAFGLVMTVQMLPLLPPMRRAVMSPQHAVGGTEWLLLAAGAMVGWPLVWLVAGLVLARKRGCALTVSAEGLGIAELFRLPRTVPWMSLGALRPRRPRRSFPFDGGGLLVAERTASQPIVLMAADVGLGADALGDLITLMRRRYSAVRAP